MTVEPFIEPFSSASLKRRHGLLRIIGADASYELSLCDGKIVSVQAKDGRAARGICSRLFEAGRLREKIFRVVAETKVGTAQLYEGLVGKNHVSHGDFVRAKVAYELDLLHLFRTMGEVTCEFTPVAIKPDPRFSLSIAPAQLLLDLAELDGDEERLNSAVGGLESTSWLVRKVAEMPRSLLGFEITVWEGIGQGISMQALAKKSLLCRYDLTQAVLALLEQSVVDVRSEGAPPAAAEGKDESDDADVFAEDLAPKEIDDLADDVFARMAYEAVDSLLDGFQGTFGKLDELVGGGSIRTERETPEQAAQNERAGAVSARKASAPSPAVEQPPTRRAQSAERLASEIAPAQVAPSSEQSVEISAQPSDDAEEFLEEPAPHRESFYARMLALNYRLLERNSKQRVLVGVMIVFLVALAVALPVTVEQWFNALREFSSTD